MGEPMSAHVPASKQICYYFKIRMQMYANINIKLEESGSTRR